MTLHVMRPLKRSTYPIAAVERAPDLVSTWLHHFPEAVPENRDSEDWIENAIFLAAFERTGVPFQILDEGSRAFVSSTADTLASGAGKGAFFHTGIRGTDHVCAPDDLAFTHQSSAHLDIISKHAQLEIFRRRAGRPIVFAKPDAASIDEAIRKIVPEDGSVFMKTLKKEWARSFTIKAGRSPWSQICEHDEGLEWSIMHLEGIDQPYFSVQGLIRPTSEYRMFMVNDEPVTGAGCIESLTPVENSNRFDFKIERIRNSGEIEDRPVLVARYRMFAESFGKKLRNEVGSVPAYSLDLCHDANTGDIVPIELNPPLNLGRYASCVDSWIKAVDRLMGGNA